MFNSLISLFLAANNDVLKKTNSTGGLPCHTSAWYNNVAGLEYLLNIYHESALLLKAVDGCTILHYAVLDKDNDADAIE